MTAAVYVVEIMLPVVIAGISFNDDCTRNCYEDEYMGDCCLIGEVDECGICYMAVAQAICCQGM